MDLSGYNTTGNTRDLLLGSGDQGAFLAFNRGAAQNVANAIPPEQAFGMAIMDLLKQSQKLGTSRFVQQGLNAQDLQTQRIKETPNELIGAAPSVQSSARNASASAVSPTIEGASQGGKTFGEQLSSFGKNVDSVKGFLKEFQDEQNKRRDDARTVIQNALTTVGGDAFKDMDEKEVADLEKVAGFPKGYLQNITKTIKERELTLKKDASPKTLETDQGILQWDPNTSAWVPIYAGMPIDGQIDFDKLAEAIGMVESSNNYQAVNKKTGALGRYQVMPSNLPSWTREALGVVLTPQQFLASPDAQDKVFKYMTDKYYREDGSLDNVISKWFSGQPAQGNNAQDVMGTSTPAYITKVKSLMGLGGNIASAQTTTSTSTPTQSSPVKPTTLQPVKPKSDKTAQEKQKVNQAQVAETLVKQAEDLYSKAVGGEYQGPGAGVASRVKGVGRFVGRVTGVQQNVQTYNNFIESNLATIARGLKGEVGTLTEGDIDRARAAFPRISGLRASSPKEAKAAFDILKQQIKDNLEIFGGASREIEQGGGSGQTSSGIGWTIIP